MAHFARKEAAERLDDLLDEATRGEEVIIEHEDGRHFRLVAERSQRAHPSPCFGSARGEVWLAENFDEPLEDLAEYME